MDEGSRVISQVTRHETWVLVLIQVGDGGEWNELDDVNSLGAFADLVDRFHVEYGCVRGFVVELGEVRDGCEKMLNMGGLEV